MEGKSEPQAPLVAALKDEELPPLTKRHGIAGFLLAKVDEHVDELHDILAPLVAKELEHFQGKTLDALEQQLSLAWVGIFTNTFDVLRHHHHRDGVKKSNPTVASKREVSLTSERGAEAEAKRSMLSDAKAKLRAKVKAHENDTSSSSSSSSSSDEEDAAKRKAKEDEDAYGARGRPFYRPDADPDVNAEQVEEELKLDLSVILDDLTHVLEWDPLLPFKPMPDVSQQEQEEQRVVSKLAWSKKDPNAGAKSVVPGLKEQIAELLSTLHAPIASQFVTLALYELKHFLREHVRAREVLREEVGLGHSALEDFRRKLHIHHSDPKKTSRSIGAKTEPEEVAKSADDKPQVENEAAAALGEATLADVAAATDDVDAEESKQESDAAQVARSVQIHHHGLAVLLSTKLSDGLTAIRAATRARFRRILTLLEKKLFEALPASMQRPLVLAFGGNPFLSHKDDEKEKDKALPSVPAPEPHSTSRSLHSTLAAGQTALSSAAASVQGAADHLSASSHSKANELRASLHAAIAKIQSALRARVLELVGGGHRALEREIWRLVQSTVQRRIQEFVPEAVVSIQSREAETKPLKHTEHLDKEAKEGNGEAATYYKPA